MDSESLDASKDKTEETSSLESSGSTVSLGNISLSMSTLSMSPASGNAGDTATIYLTLKDADGNIIDDDSRAGVLTLSAQGAAGGTGSFGSFSYDGAGVYSAQFTFELVGSNNIEAGIGTWTFSDTEFFTVVDHDTSPSVAEAVDDTYSYMTLEPSVAGPTTVVANGAELVSITYYLYDAYGNPVDEVTPTFGSSGTINTQFACSSSNPSGVSTCSMSSTKAETKTISTLTPSGITTLIDDIEFVAGNANDAYSSISGSPVTINGTNRSTITVVLGDIFDNPVIGTTPVFTASGSSNTVYSCSATDTAGMSTCELGSTYAEVKTISITSPSGLTVNSNVTFSPGAAYKLAFDSQPALNSDNKALSSLGSISVRILDQWDNHVTSAVNNVDLSIYTNPGSGALSGTTSVAATAGTAWFSNISINKPGDGYELEASSGVLIDATGNAFNIIGRDLEVPVDMIDVPLSSDTSDRTFMRTQTRFDTDDYDGNKQHYFEIVATNSDNADRDVILVNSFSSYVSSISVGAHTTMPERLRSSFSPTSGSDVYAVRLPATTASNNLIAYQARMLVQQTNATKTAIYYPLVAGSSGSYTFSDGSSAAVDSALSATTFTQSAPYNYTLFKNDSSNYAVAVSGFTSWQLDAVMSNTGAGTSVALFVHGSSSEVASSTVTAGYSTLPTLYSSGNISSLNSSFGDFHAKISSPVSYYIYLYRAGLWQKLTDLTKVQVYYRTGLGAYASDTTKYTNYYNRTNVDLSLFTLPSIYNMVVCNTSIAANHAILDGGVSASGVTTYTGANHISGSSVSISSSGSMNIYSSSEMSGGITNGNDYYTGYNLTAVGTGTFNSSFITIRAE